MAEISRVNLFGKLNPLAYKAIESASVFCKMRGNPYVEMVHWIQQILQNQDTDLHRILQHFDIDNSALAKDITQSLDELPRGATSISDLSSHIEDAVERAWVYGSLAYGDNKIRLGYLIVGTLKTRNLKQVLYNISAEFKKIKIEELSDDLNHIVSGSPEEQTQSTDGQESSGESSSGELSPASMGKQEALNKFTTDLTEDARSGKLDPIVGRDDEIRQLIDILMRRRQNNPILTGEAGVGKTAVVEGFAHRIIRGDVPPDLQGVQIKSLDLGLLQAGASMKGEFESRLKQVIEEVQSSETPIVMFIDETHTLIGAGGASGTGDAANLLKPALARGELRTIGATTWAEYKKHIEKDPALTRRFQVVKVEEPNEDKAILMLRNIAGVLEKHHNVEVIDEAISTAVKLSKRYIPARQLPDKAVSLLDTACARVAISQFSIPAEIESCQNSIEQLQKEKQLLESEIPVTNHKRIEEILGEVDSTNKQIEELQSQWQKEKKIVGDIISLKRKLKDDSEDNDNTEDNDDEKIDPQGIIDNIISLEKELGDLKANQRFILQSCNAQAVANVVADWTGIPVGKMVDDEVKTILNLTSIINDRVIGQDHGIDMIAKRIQTSRASLDDPNKPVGVFMLCGPSGVGKTETALALAETLYGGEQNLITINMSEFQEAHTVSTLKGAPPGYVGYGEGGVLTEAVRRRPHSVVLLDEVEKAHPDVHEIFFQVFDKGVMEDGEGRTIDFKNTLIILTTNVGSELIMNTCKQGKEKVDSKELSENLRTPLLEVFPPALLGRIVNIPYYPLSDAMLAMISRLQMERIKKRVEQNHGIAFNYSDEVIEQIVSRCTEVDSGGRMIDAILTNTLLPEISAKYLSAVLESKAIEHINVSVNDCRFDFDFKSAK